jgi:hypothetical protein
MSISEDLKLKLKNNQRDIFIADSDDLLAAWRHRKEKTSHSCRCFDFSRVPIEYRLSAPPNERAELIPCHVSVRCHRSHIAKTIKPAPEYFTSTCHGYGQNTHLSTQDLDAQYTVSFAKRSVAPYISPIMDTVTLSRVCKDLGITGRAIPKVIKGRQYIAFSGYPGLRTMFPGTIYSANNRKIITMAIGAIGIKNMVKSGGILTICITVPLTILEAFLNDKTSIYELIGNIASDLVKVGIASVIGAVAGLAFGGIVTVAAIPIAVTIAVSVGSGIGLNVLDEKYHLTEKLSKALEDFSDQIAETTKNGINETTRSVYRGLEEFIRWQTGYSGPL